MAPPLVLRLQAVHLLPLRTEVLWIGRVNWWLVEKQPAALSVLKLWRCFASGGGAAGAVRV